MDTGCSAASRVRYRRQRGGQQGYALLVLIGFAAILMAGITVSLQKATFEGRRDKEEELIFRGMQYERAIQLFYRKFGRYPNSVDEMLQTNNIRFLRKKYTDPMTKDGAWRMIRLGPNGALLGALTNPLQGLIASAPGATGSTGGSSAQTGSTSQTGVLPGIGGTFQNGGGSSPNTGQGSGTQGFGQGFGGQGFGSGSSPGSPSPGAGVNSGMGPGGGLAGLGPPGAPVDPSQFPAANPNANPYNQSAPSAPSGGQGSQPQGSSAPYSNPQSLTPSQGSDPTLPSGPIAGFASQSKEASIRVLNGYDEYDKWEFIFDPRLDPLTAARAAQAQTPAQTGTGLQAQPSPNVPGAPLQPGQPGTGPGQSTSTIPSFPNTSVSPVR